MILKCVEPFGNFTPGDIVEVPDGALFDTAFFAEDKVPEEVPDSNSEDVSRLENDGAPAPVKDEG